MTQIVHIPQEATFNQKFISAGAGLVVGSMTMGTFTAISSALLLREIAGKIVGVSLRTSLCAISGNPACTDDFLACGWDSCDSFYGNAAVGVFLLGAVVSIAVSRGTYKTCCNAFRAVNITNLQKQN